jgi:hypothetical protein
VPGVWLDRGAGQRRVQRLRPPARVTGEAAVSSRSRCRPCPYRRARRIGTETCQRR